MPATEEAEECYGTIQDMKEILETCDKALADYDDYLYEAIKRGVNVSGRANVQKRAGAKKFSESLFASAYPELYKKYSSVSFPVRGTFRVKPAKDWNPEIRAINEEQVELLVAFTDQLVDADHSMDTGFALHEKHLGVLEIKKYAEWNIEIANVKLRVMTGDAEGIDGICTWKREEKEVVSFDKQQLEADYPEQYNACVIQGAETQALIVEPKIAQN